MRKERRKPLSCHFPKCCHEALANLSETSTEQPFSGSSERAQLIHAAAAAKETEEVNNSKQGLGANEVWKQPCISGMLVQVALGQAVRVAFGLGHNYRNAAINTLLTLVRHCFEEDKSAKIRHFLLVIFVMKNWVKWFLIS